MSERTRDLIAALVSRYESEQAERAEPGAPSATARHVAAILGTLGWRAASDAPAEEVAPRIAQLIAACAHGRRDLGALRRDVADQLRRYAHALDGGLAPVFAWEPTAAQLIARYARGEEGPGAPHPR